MEDLKKRRKRKSLLGIGVILLVVLFCFGWNQSGKIEAEEPTESVESGIYIDGTKVVGSYIMERPEVEILYIGTSDTYFSVSPNQKVIEVKEYEDKNGNMIYALRASGVGKASVYCWKKGFFCLYG